MPDKHTHNGEKNFSLLLKLQKETTELSMMVIFATSKYIAGKWSDVLQDINL